MIVRVARTPASGGGAVVRPRRTKIGSVVLSTRGRCRLVQRHVLCLVLCLGARTAEHETSSKCYRNPPDPGIQGGSRLRHLRSGLYRARTSRNREHGEEGDRRRLHLAPRLVFARSSRRLGGVTIFRAPPAPPPRLPRQHDALGSA